MQKGRLSYYSAAVLGLLGVFFLLSLILSFYGIGNAPGDFLKASFTYVSFFIPLYIFTAAILSFKEKFRSRWIILLTLTILPFLTLVLFLKVYLDIDNSLPVSFTINFIGRKEGSFLLFLLFLVEILLIYVLSMKMSNTKNVNSIEDLDRSDIIEEPLQEKEDSYLRNKILQPGISAELLGTSLNSTLEEVKTAQPGGNSSDLIISEGLDVDLPELLSLDKLRSLERYSSSDSLVSSEKDKDLSIAKNAVI